MDNKLRLSFEYDLFDNEDELFNDWKLLLVKAREVMTNAYSPYSNYKVGAALLLENGEIVTGSNQENAAFPSGLCAERVAFFAAGSAHPGVAIKRAVVVARKPGNNNLEVAAPCGGCRQVMLEYELKQEKPIQLLLVYKNSKFLVASSIESLVPLSFNKHNLE
ncbi:MAG TPA: cytidine deaminase [Cyclobacteriaceae bacterium]|jgi:cytidine deaminase